MSTLEGLIASIKTFPDTDQRRISALLGATVADVASRPLHWIYNQEQLNNIIGDTKETEFWPENNCPFFTIPLGRPTAYNDTTLVTLRSVTTTNGNPDLEHICQSLKQQFGPASDYGDALERRKAAYAAKKSPSDVVPPISGPWVHKAMLLLLENYEKNRNEMFIGDTECKEYDVFCAALPLIAKHAGNGENMWTEATKLTSLFTSNACAIEMFHTSAMLVENCILGNPNPIAEVTETVESLYPSVHELMSEVKEAKSLSFITSVATFGKACYLPGTFQGALLAILQSSSFVDAIRLNISAGGCSCGRGNFIGAYFAARDGINCIPIEWLNRVENIEEIIEMAMKLISPSPPQPTQ